MKGDDENLDLIGERK